jgi:hypothetical protein
MPPRLIYTNAILQLAFNILNWIFLRPLFDIIPITIQPRSLCADRIQALSQTLVESFSAAVFEELLDSSYAVLACKTGGADRDHGSEHGEARWEAAGEFVPVFGHPDVESFDAFGVGA